MRWCSLRFVILGYLVACGDGAGPTGNSARICSAPLRVSATRSITPTVTWAGGCRVNQIAIHEGGPYFSLAWVPFFPSDSNLMVPPVAYGVLPNGARQLPDNPQPLQPGVTYMIDVNISDTSQNGAIVRVGSDTIVP
jgi:hypothetical protein